jgi:signal transduction histidine kinase
MKPILASILFLLFITTTHAQKPSKLDSLKNILAHLPAEGRSFAGDTLRVRVLCEMGEEVELTVASEYFQRAIVVSQKYLDFKNVQFAKYKLAKFYKKKGMFFYAIPKMYEILKEVEKSGESDYLGSIYRELADCYLRLESFKYAEKYYKLSIDVFKKSNNYVEYVDTQNNLGLVFYNTKDYKSAIKAFDDCKLYETNVKNTIYEASYLSNLGSCYRELNEYEKAKIYFNKSIFIYQNLDKKYAPFLSTTLVEYALVFEKLGDLNTAIKLADKATAIDKTNYGNDLFTNEILERLHHKKGNSEKAYFYLKNYLIAKQNSTLRSQKEQVESLKNEYNLTQQKNSNALLVKDIEKESFIKEVFAVGLLFLICFVAYFIYSNSKLKTKQKEIELKSESLNVAKIQLEDVNSNLEITVQDRTKELRIANENLIQKNTEILAAMVKGQTIERRRVASELHDNIGSTISAVKWRMESLNDKNLSKNEQKVYFGIIEMINTAYSEIRLISHNLIPKELEINGLETGLSKFINDVNENKITIIDFEYNLNSILPEKIAIEVYSICLELINNILKHSKAKKGILSIVNVENNLRIKVCDDGLGINYTNLNIGIGLKNIKDRLHSINGKYSLSSSKKFNTEIVIEIPLL